ncbi:phenylacetate--CoA ligase family protein [Parachryseolinea silvisoli]|uniref:phenylacetate--CoA ligase family protein n=1 Tax=Parachryseolinea silvisoli TaxID=2873601 RepID=UPI002265800B|nr:AMP-binding protein [Parachryseolinea silvisoli]MCD9014553.1 AMP-binding protein [Parachryseolinea silvisoli]
MSQIPEIEFRSAQEIRAVQEMRLQQLLAYVAQYSPFYQRLFATHGIDAGSIQRIEDLVRLPRTSKDDLQQHNWDFLCVPRSAIAEYTSTSGTLGKPVTLALTAADRTRLAYNEYISFCCADGTAGDTYQLMLTLDRQFMAGMAYYEGIRQLGAAVVRVGPGLPAMQWETIERIRPTVLVGVPSFVVKLLEYAQAHGIDPAKTSVRKVICIGESLRTASFELGVIGQKIRNVWDVALYSTYASTEMQTAFTECGAGQGGHHHPELLMVEILDDAGQPVPPGTPGEVTITTLGVEGMPLVRYRTGDLAAAHTTPCSCGRTTLRLGPIVGRRQQMIKLKGTTIYPPGIFELLNQVPAVQDYVVEAVTGALNTDELRLHVLVKEAQREETMQRLPAMFQATLRVVPEIRFVTAGELEQLQFGKLDRKVRRFLDHRSGSD